MSAEIFSFLTEWLRKYAVGRVGSADDVKSLVAKCAKDARAEGISIEELEKQVGPLDECISRALTFVGR